MTRREVDVVLRRTRKALRRLDAKQGSVGRRNARRAIAAALRLLRAEIDEQYPSLAKRQRRQARRAQSLEAKRKALFAAGWHVVTSVIVAQRLHEAGAAMRSLKGAAYARDWAIRLATAGVSRAELRKAIRSVSYRDALLAEVALRRRIAAGEDA